METYSGRCLCEVVRYTVKAKSPACMYLCHCSRCRRETGTLHGANVFFRSGTLTFDEGEDQVSTYALARTRKRRAFCSMCGSPVARQEPDGAIVLPAGGLDDDERLEPTAHIFCESGASWTEKAAAAKRFPEGPA